MDITHPFLTLCLVQMNQYTVREQIKLGKEETKLKSLTMNPHGLVKH